MAEQASKRQRTENESSNLTPSERTEGMARQQSAQRGGQVPSIFSVTPGEFFTLSPISLMRRFTEDIDRAFFGSGTASGRQGAGSMVFTPNLEVRREGNNVVVSADLPGLNEGDVRVEVTDEGLVIEGERRQEQSNEEGGWRHSEVAYGRFYRLIPLPEGAQSDEAQASFNNGVLQVKIPVPESKSQRRQIPISQGQTQGGQQPQASGSGQASRAAGGR